MKPAVLSRILLGVVLSIAFLTLGCSSDNSGSTTKADAGKKDTGASGGSGGSGGGSGGSSARGGSGGSGGSSARGGASGSGGGSGGSSSSGGSSASGGSGGGGGASASGGAGGLGGSSGSGGAAGGSGGTGGTGGDAGNVPVDGGGSIDAELIDALDAPLLSNDGAISETGASNDGGVPILLDTGAQDSEGVDSKAIDTTVVFLDAEAETAVADAAADMAPDTADAGTCLQQIISNGYAFLPANPCGQCQDTTQPSHPDLHTQCQGMIDCLEAASCQNSLNNCWLTCRNAVSGNQIATETCVTALVTAACH